MGSFHRSRRWVVLVWFVVGLVLFPLTPPISQNVTFEQNVLSPFNETPAFMRVAPESFKITVPALPPPIPWHEQEHRPDPCYLLLLVIYIIFLHSKIPKILKKVVLAPLKYTSDYVAFAYSFPTAR
ncbi:hypothetical protein N0M98_26670 [Paenibacillus doosanensis]|uniref:Uncharacterized protein n=1 Tax=Paenibacillus konkukensis TaxID=2020716 RepID=A0ABY4RU88_9BACL|nr:MULTISPECIES: hypothetical protein [Paenibacillus]MCS7463694.1 hypothetical protein [Paenibacillus doosanensis]UQZ85815.1 hypothetical protein SK3146_05104 [Paenibacillus konkukensis]